MNWRYDDSTVKQRDYLFKMYKRLGLNPSGIRSMTKGEAFDAIQRVKPDFDKAIEDEYFDMEPIDGQD